MTWKVTIERLWKIEPIPNADNIETAFVKGWQCVVPKGQFHPMDLVIFVPIDSIVPQIPYFDFMVKHHYRVHTMKLKGQISQGLVIKTDDFAQQLLQFNEEWFKDHQDSFTSFILYLFEHNCDISKDLAIVKYEKEVPAQMNGIALRSIPMPPTDEPRIQENPEFFLAMLQKYRFEVTEKLDGTSVTYYLDDQGHFGVCSRNYELKEDANNTAWKYAKEHYIEETMKRLNLVNIAIRGEMCGPKIGTNSLQLSQPEFYVFNIFNMATNEYVLPIYRGDIVIAMQLHHVPVINFISDWHGTLEGILAVANGRSQINLSVEREGLVFKCLSQCPEGENNWCSFKVINNNYALKNKE